MSIRHPNPLNQPIPQVGLNPTVRESIPIACEGGPCDGQMMRCPDGFVLILTDAVDGLRATALPLTINPVRIANEVGGYGGHYEKAAPSVLVWRAATPEARDGE